MQPQQKLFSRTMLMVSHRWVLTEFNKDWGWPKQIEFSSTCRMAINFIIRFFTTTTTRRRRTVTTRTGSGRIRIKAATKKHNGQCHVSDKWPFSLLLTVFTRLSMQNSIDLHILAVVVVDHSKRWRYWHYMTILYPVSTIPSHPPASFCGSLLLYYLSMSRLRKLFIQ